MKTIKINDVKMSIISVSEPAYKVMVKDYCTKSGEWAQMNKEHLYKVLPSLFNAYMEHKSVQPLRNAMVSFSVTRNATRYKAILASLSCHGKDGMGKVMDKKKYARLIKIDPEHNAPVWQVKLATWIEAQEKESEEGSSKTWQEKFVAAMKREEKLLDDEDADLASVADLLEQHIAALLAAIPAKVDKAA